MNTNPLTTNLSPSISTNHSGNRSIAARDATAVVDMQNRQMAETQNAKPTASASSPLAAPALPKTPHLSHQTSKKEVSNARIAKMFEDVCSKVGSKSIHINSTAVERVAKDKRTTRQFDADELKKSIGEYSLEAREKTSHGNVQAKPLTSRDVRERVETCLQNDLSILNRGIDHPPTTRARERFIDFLAQRINEYECKTWEDTVPKEERTISLAKLLGGPEGVKMYHAAIKEERNSPAFREAVFYQATKQYHGPPLEKRMILWIGGPSSSGKSYAADKLIEHLLPSDQNKKTMGENLVVSIDGGIEREMSQMRQLALQLALSKGHSGIEDLHEHTHLGIKTKIQKAAVATPNLNLVIPNTFSNPLTQRKIDLFSKIEGSQQIFAEILGAGDFEELENKKNKHLAEKQKELFKKKQETFQKTVESLGNSRAWLGNDKVYDGTVTMNNRKIPCESKNYNPKYFHNGVNGSRRAREKALKQNIPFVGYKNELEILRNDNDKITTSVIDGFLDNQKMAFKSRAALAAWLNQNEKAGEEFDSWLKSPQAKELGVPKFYHLPRAAKG